MLLFLVCAFVVYAVEGVSLFVDGTSLMRPRRQARQIYYLCGTYPNQYYSRQPCYVTQSKCTNGGQTVGAGCTNAAQCTPYYRGVSTCINGCCCTVPVVAPGPPAPGRASGYCHNGQLSNVRCSAQGQCPSGRACINGLCCTITGEEYRFACGGLLALSSCTNGQCSQGFHCTPSNYCCECAVGRSSGRCNQGLCPAGFSCQANGYCCASCPGNTTPYGACRNGACGGGFTCRAGNICC